jgi:hypothetical protein
MVGGSTSAAAFSVSDDACGAFYVVAFDRYGRPIHGHPLGKLLFGDARSALAAIEGFASASAPAQSFVCPSDDAAE